MKSRTIRIITFLAVLSIAGIISIQTFWMKHVFDLKEKQFEHNATIALQNVAEKILTYNHLQIPLSSLVDQVSSDYFVITTNCEIETGLLEYLLKSEFEKRNLIIDFEYGVYNCQSQKMVYGNYVSFDKSDNKPQTRELPVWKNDSYYFIVVFPEKTSDLLNQMSVWLFINIVLLLVCAFFAYSIFVILKQKRLWEVQKDFINNMTHEFKTPISTILVSVDLLQKPEINKSELRLMNYTTVIHNETLRLKNQVEKVLKAAMLDKDKIKLHLEIIDLHDCLTIAMNSIILLVEQKKGEIKLNLDAINYFVYADHVHLSNIFYNLLDNALKYCEKNPYIVISTKNEKNTIIVSIKDNGIGIEKKNQKRIFDKFYRVHTGNIHDVKGFGLGLYYVKTIVRAHKGTVKVLSEKNTGTEIILTIPLNKSENGKN